MGTKSKQPWDFYQILANFSKISYKFIPLWQFLCKDVIITRGTTQFEINYLAKITKNPTQKFSFSLSFAMTSVVIIFVISQESGKKDQMLRYCDFFTNFLPEMRIWQFFLLRKKNLAETVDFIMRYVHKSRTVRFFEDKKYANNTCKLKQTG